MGFGTASTRPATPAPESSRTSAPGLAAEIGDDRWERIAEPIEQAVTEQKKLPPNVDWPSARLYHYMGLDISIYTPIFAMARSPDGRPTSSSSSITPLDAPPGPLHRPPNRAVTPLDRRA